MSVVDPVDTLIKTVSTFFEENEHPDAVVRYAITGTYLVQLKPAALNLLMRGDNLDKLNDKLQANQFGKIKCGINNTLYINRVPLK